MEQIKDKCSSCRYRSPAYSELYPNGCGCDFAYLTGHIRGCPAGEGCKRFEPGPRLKPNLLGPLRQWEDAAMLERILWAGRSARRREKASRQRSREEGGDSA